MLSKEEMLTYDIKRIGGEEVRGLSKSGPKAKIGTLGILGEKVVTEELNVDDPRAAIQQRNRNIAEEGKVGKGRSKSCTRNDWIDLKTSELGCTDCSFNGTSKAFCLDSKYMSFVMHSLPTTSPKSSKNLLSHFLLASISEEGDKGDLPYNNLTHG